jgi:hypothetical protein
MVPAGNLEVGSSGSSQAAIPSIALPSPIRRLSWFPTNPLLGIREGWSVLTLRNDLDSHVPATVTDFLVALFVSVAPMVAVSVARIVTQCEETI